MADDIRYAIAVITLALGSIAATVLLVFGLVFFGEWLFNGRDRADPPCLRSHDESYKNGGKYRVCDEYAPEIPEGGENP